MNTIIIILATFLTIISLGIAFLMQGTKEYFREQKKIDYKDKIEELLETIRLYLDHPDTETKIDDFGRELMEDAARIILEEEDKIRKANEERDLAEKMLVQRYENQGRQTSQQADWMP